MKPLDPDIADKVLGADLRNHVKKVGGGSTLSNSDRQMFIAFAATGDGEDLRAVRQSNLLKKWLFGGKLTKEEQEECINAGDLSGWRGVLSAAEVKLKEKNT